MSNKTKEVLGIYGAKVMPTYTPSVVLASGKGITVRDVDGRSYYDFTSGIGVQSVGYSNKKVVEAVQRSFQSPIVANGTSLIEVEIGVLTKLRQRERVDIQLVNVAPGHLEIRQRVFGKALYLEQLFG